MLVNFNKQYKNTIHFSILFLQNFLRNIFIVLFLFDFNISEGFGHIGILIAIFRSNAKLLIMDEKLIERTNTLNQIIRKLR